MSDDRTDKILREELRALPRRRAGEGFTAKVLARLDERQPRFRPGWRFRPWGRFRPWPAVATGIPPWGTALAVAVLLALALGLPFVLREVSGRGGAGPAAGLAVSAQGARLEELRQEQERLAVELATLKRLAAEPAPVVYLGGDEQTDVILDLGSLARRRAEARIRPASYGGPGNR